MLEKNHGKQDAAELVTYEILVPKDHLLRQIEEAVDFKFINDLCAPLYCEGNGRPAIEPEILFRMLFVGYLYGIRSERRLEEEVNYNMAYKWFCKLGLTERAPDHSTFTANRRRRFRDNRIAEMIFDEILRQAASKGLVAGKILYTDSTHVKANANKHKKKAVLVEETPKAYMEALDEQIDRDRESLGKKPFNRDSDEDDSTSHTIQQSTTDPGSGQLHKEGKPDGFHYSEHRTVDSKHNIIVNVHVTAASVNDVDPIPDIIQQVNARLGHMPEVMGLDAGYHCAPVCKQLTDAGIQGVIGYRRHTHAGDHLGKYRFLYDPIENCYLCPQKQKLRWKTTNRNGYREYWSDQEQCSRCPMRQQCFSEKASRRLVTRHVWQGLLDMVDTYTKTPAGRQLYSWRKETIERSFADAKQLHGLRTARARGLASMREQSFLTAAAQNIKKIAMVSSSFFTALSSMLSSVVCSRYIKPLQIA
jgi:transposase